MNTYLQNSVSEAGWLRRIFCFLHLILLHCVISNVCNDSAFIDGLCEDK